MAKRQTRTAPTSQTAPVASPTGAPPREMLRTLVRNRYDIQRLRIAVAGRLKRHADVMKLRPELADWLKNQERYLVAVEKSWVDQVAACLANEPIAQWLMGLDGIAETTAAFVVAEFDITKADTASKMWSYAGLGMESPYRVVFSVGDVETDAAGRPVSDPIPMLQGRDARALTDVSPPVIPTDEDLDAAAADDEIVPERPIAGAANRRPTLRKNTLYETVIYGTSEGNARTCIPVYKEEDLDILRVYSVSLLPGQPERQRPRRGQRTSYNVWLRSKLLGVLGPSFLRCFAPKYYEIYANYRNRLLSDITAVANPREALRIKLYHEKCAASLAILRDAGLREEIEEDDGHGPPTVGAASDDEVTGTHRHPKLTDEQRAAKKRAAAVKQSANNVLKTAMSHIRADVHTHWESPGHLHRAATRYMVKLFIVDLHKKWRGLAGLPVRGTYQEEKLLHTHGGGGVAIP